METEFTGPYSPQGRNHPWAGCCSWISTHNLRLIHSTRKLAGAPRSQEPHTAVLSPQHRRKWVWGQESDRIYYTLQLWKMNLHHYSWEELLILYTEKPQAGETGPPSLQTDRNKLIESVAAHPTVKRGYSDIVLIPIVGYHTLLIHPNSNP